jgi:thiopeptide-type bacteriocin biosynthesis protein
VALEDGDNVLVLDLENVLSVKTFIRLVANRVVARLVELFPDPDQLCVRGPEGPFRHELLVPFLAGAPAVATLPVAPRRPPATVTRAFPPGSEWLYLKIFTGTATADQVLREVVAPLVRRALGSAAARSWFFLRLDEQGHHLRVRLRGEPSRLYGEVLPEFERASRQLLQDGTGWQLQIDTYQREVERYGGDLGIQLSERIFAADSDAVLAIVERFPGDRGVDLRWRLALAGIDLLLRDLGLDLSARHQLLDQMRQDFSREFKVEVELARQIGERFRSERQGLDRLLDPERADGNDPLGEGLAILRRRSETLAPTAAELRQGEAAGLLGVGVQGLASSYIHMHVNRMLRAQQRAHELVLYDFLHRLYEGRLARARKRPSVEAAPSGA